MKLVTPMSVLASVCLLAGCSVINEAKHAVSTAVGRAPSSSSSPSSSAPVVAEADLPGLLLSEADANTALGATGMAILPAGAEDEMSDDSGEIANKDCVALYSNAESTVYDGSGYLGVRERLLQDDPDIDNAKFRLDQAVVGFHSAGDAAKFFTTSSQSWPACANQKFDRAKSSQSRGGTWITGPVSTKNGVLSSTITQEGRSGEWECQRALTAANNIVVDIDLCSASPNDTAITVANQIAAKVAK